MIGDGAAVANSTAGATSSVIVNQRLLDSLTPQPLPTASGPYGGALTSYSLPMPSAPWPPPQSFYVTKPSALWHPPPAYPQSRVLPYGRLGPMPGAALTAPPGAPLQQPVAPPAARPKVPQISPATTGRDLPIFRALRLEAPAAPSGAGPIGPQFLPRLAAAGLEAPLLAKRRIGEPEEEPEDEFEEDSFSEILDFDPYVELVFLFESNFDLDNDTADDRFLFRPILGLETEFYPSDYFEAYLNLELFADVPMLDEFGDQTTDVSLSLSEAYGDFIYPLEEQDLFLRLGRQRYVDDREWLYDDNLDAARLFFETEDTRVEVSAVYEGFVPRDIWNDDDLDSKRDRANFYIGYVKHKPIPELDLTAYVLKRQDKEFNSSTGDFPLFLGLHSDGKFFDRRLRYWLEFAHVRGEDFGEDIDAYGFDIGGRYEFDLPLEPRITLGYAFGTGDGDQGDGNAHDFRQTGLQGNQASFGGVTGFEYYGVLLDPELSNLHIPTLAVGFNPTPDSSVDVVYHYYRQIEPTDFLFDSGIDIDPDGFDVHIGNEIDVVAGYEFRQRPGAGGHFRLLHTGKRIRLRCR